MNKIITTKKVVAFGLDCYILTIKHSKPSRETDLPSLCDTVSLRLVLNTQTFGYLCFCACGLKTCATTDTKFLNSIRYVINCATNGLLHAENFSFGAFTLEGHLSL